MTCNFLFVNGSKIGTYCGEIATVINGKSARCNSCVNETWPKEIYQCQREITKGPRSGQLCNKNTRFADLKCSVCRRVELGHQRIAELSNKIIRETFAEEEFERRRQAFVPPVEDPEATDKYDCLAKAPDHPEGWTSDEWADFVGRMKNNTDGNFLSVITRKMGKGKNKDELAIDEKYRLCAKKGQEKALQTVVDFLEHQAFVPPVEDPEATDKYDCLQTVQPVTAVEPTKETVVVQPTKESDVGHISAYSIFRDMLWEDVAASNPNLPPIEINRIIGQQYRDLHDTEKEEYKIQAKERRRPTTPDLVPPTYDLPRFDARFPVYVI